MVKTDTTKPKKWPPSARQQPRASTRDIGTVEEHYSTENSAGRVRRGTKPSLDFYDRKGTKE